LNFRNRLSNWIRSYVAFSQRRKGSVIATSFVFLALGAFFSTHLRVTPSLEALLPRDTRTIKALQETDKRFGSSDMYTLAIMMKDPVELCRVQREVKEKLLKWNEVVYAQDDRDNKFFMDHALLYVPPKHLEKVVENLKDLQLELGMKGPLTLDLLSGDGSNDNLRKKREWFDASLPQQLGLPDEAAEPFGKFLKSDKPENEQVVAAANAAAVLKVADPKDTLPDSLKTRMLGNVGDGRWIAVIQAVLKKPSSDIDYVKKIIAYSNGTIIAPYKAKYSDSVLQISVEGPYNALEDVNSIEWDGLIATLVSIGLNILLIVVFFRKVSPVLLIAGQVVFTCVLTLGATGLVYGRLNLYTLFVISILFGMGIDYAIYAIGYAQKYLTRGRTWLEAMSETLDTLFFSLLVAMLTTAGGLLCLLASRFVGFYEFGVIGSVGIVLSLLATFLVLPAWVFQFEVWHKQTGWRMFDLVPKEDRPMLPGVDKIKNWPVLIRSTAFACLAITAVLAFYVPRGIVFEYDFANLRDKPRTLTKAEQEYRAKHDFPVSAALASKRRSSQPVVVVANTQAAMDELHDTLMHRLTVDRDTLLRSFLTYRTFVPKDADQAERLPYLKAIDSLVSIAVFDKAEGDDGDMIQRLRNMSKAQKFGAEQIPPWALNLLRERDSSYGKIAFIYGSFNSSNAQEAAKFEERYGHFNLKGEEPRAFSSAFIYADIVRLVKEDAGRMAMMMAGVLILMLAMILRSFRYVLISAIGMLVGTVWTLGICGFLGYKINVFNIIAITTLQGVAVDVTTYLILAYLRLGKERMGDLFGGIAGLMAVAELTTLSGYAGMLFVNNQGIASIGKFAVIGLAVLLVTSLMLTPWLCTVLIPDSHVKSSDDIVG
jgi:uncharacterized protein